MEIFNAKIICTRLGFEDHGIFGLFINMEYERGVQAFCVELDNNGLQIIKSILEVCKEDSWEKLVGTYVRIKRRDGIIKAVGNIIYDEWFDIEEFYKEE